MEPLTAADPGRLGEITLEGRLGAGGMGQVYLGVAPGGERVAVKTLTAHHLDRDDLRERFGREIVAMGMVQGPGTAALVAASEPDADPPWLAMEYVPGRTLRDHVRGQGPLDGELGAALGLALARALADIHRAGLLHRDLKPHNVMLGPQGPRVIDFGLVAIGGPGGELTGTNAHLGTPLCMAPEQATSPDRVTAAADVFGLGATLLFALADRYPYEGPTSYAILAALTDPDTSPNLEGVPATLAPLLARLLAHDPAHRPALSEVRGLLGEQLAASGRSPAAAHARLVRETCPAVPEAPAPDPAVPVEPPPDPARPAAPAAPVALTEAAPVVVEVAERLRRDYARAPAH